jgi:hypothetical protein
LTQWFFDSIGTAAESDAESDAGCWLLSAGNFMLLTGEEDSPLKAIDFGLVSSRTPLLLPSSAFFFLLFLRVEAGVKGCGCPLCPAMLACLRSFCSVCSASPWLDYPPALPSPLDNSCACAPA